jgi:uncharacterized membrane protein (Fun14 family)
MNVFIFRSSIVLMAFSLIVILVIMGVGACGYNISQAVSLFSTMVGIFFLSVVGLAYSVSKLK